MAKSSRSKSKKGTASKKIIKKSPQKSVAAKKTKKVTKKKAVAKKATPKKVVAKKTIVKKKAAKKSIAKNIKSKKTAIKKAAPARQTVKTPKIRIEKIKAKNKENIAALPDLNEQPPTANDYIGMIDANIGIPEEKPIDNNNNDNQLNLFVHAVPAPEEKYSRPADPYHGNKAPRKGKRNIVPSGKKPLWNK